MIHEQTEEIQDEQPTKAKQSSWNPIWGNNEALDSAMDSDFDPFFGSSF